MRITALALLFAFLPGCGALLLYDDSSGGGLGFHSGSVAQVVATRGEEHRRVIEVDPWPLVVRCIDEARSTRERIHEVRYGYDGPMRLGIGMLALAEAGLAAGMSYAATVDDFADWGWFIPAGILAIDSLMAFGFAIFSPPTVHVAEYEREGSWHTVTERCPAELWIEVSGTPVAVRDGVIAEDDHARLLAQLVAAGELRIAIEGHEQVVTVSPEERCALAREHRIEVPECMAPPAVVVPPPTVVVPPPTVVVPPPPPRAPLRIELQIDSRGRRR